VFIRFVTVGKDPNNIPCVDNQSTACHTFVSVKQEQAVVLSQGLKISGSYKAILDLFPWNVPMLDPVQYDPLSPTRRIHGECEVATTVSHFTNRLKEIR
jgi:hypothetical protein